MRAQEKVPKEKGTRCPHRLTPMPCVPRQSGGAHNSEFNEAGLPAPLNLPRTGCAPVPGLAAVLGECDGTGGGTPFPLALPSIAGILRASEPPCRAGFASRRRGKCCESGERSKYREAQGTRVSGQAVGPAFLLGAFLWRRKEKYLARKGETCGWKNGCNCYSGRKLNLIRAALIAGRFYGKLSS